MNNYEQKLAGMMDDSLHTKKIWNDENLDTFFEKYGISSFNGYRYFLKNYGNDYVKEGYYFKDNNDPLIVEKEEYYELNGLFGLSEGTNNIEYEINFYKEELPSNVFPIAEIPGGDLVCMDKTTGKIYFWYHEMNGDNLVLMAESFEVFILGFVNRQTPNNTKPIIKMSLNPELDKKLREAAKKK